MIVVSQLAENLIAAGFDTGWAVRGEKIVLWVNEQPIPAEFAEYVELDEPLNLETTQE
jgi:hypothetical protein